MQKATVLSVLLLGAVLAGCGDDDAPATGEGASAGGPAEPAPPAAPEPEPEPAGPDEACAQVVVVAWQGAQYAAAAVTRSKEEARAQAEELRSRLEQGADFAETARAESDAASTAPRGGLMGTYTREEWPAVHVPIRDAVFALEVGQLGEVLEAPYGWVLARRCPVEKIHTRHILIRYRGAKNAPQDLTRTKEDARALADRLHNELGAPGADFETTARRHSDDSSADRGGDVGTLGRGRLAPEYEEAAFALQPGALSPVVETEFGFHVIQRVE
jgi:peptidyl-prolyl cis-trans isomerase SurA